jgi:hypothetical protein
MATFKIGIAVERTQTSLCIVQCEAEDRAHAQKLAMAEARKRAMRGTFRALFPTAEAINVDWQEGSYDVIGVSDKIAQEDMGHYSADFVAGE